VDLLLQNKPGIPALKLSKLPSAIAKWKNDRAQEIVSSKVSETTCANVFGQ
jgi:hypothetical protein